MMTSVLLLMYSLGAEPTPALLIEAKDLLDSKLPKTAVLIDVRSPAKYELGHLPGARQVRMSAWSKAVTEGSADGSFWCKAFSEAGLDPDASFVVVADDMREACRGWWLLRHAGVKNVGVFNGTTKTYTGSGGKLSSRTDAAPVVKLKEWKLQPAVLASKEDVLGAKCTVIDARSKDEFADGRVPKAKHLDWSELIDAKSGKFRTTEELKKLFVEHNIDPSDNPICYCASGGRASVMAFAVELVSGKPTRNYYRSWSEWGSDANTPKEK